MVYKYPSLHMIEYLSLKEFNLSLLIVIDINHVVRLEF
ncbi:hypothetical protein Sbal678_2236 [Shewanella baltica OS678]|nr:hypothetical protein Sbal678_2236 [Shewanella baltica OS678]